MAVPQQPLGREQVGAREADAPQDLAASLKARSQHPRWGEEEVGLEADRADLERLREHCPESTGRADTKGPRAEAAPDPRRAHDLALLSLLSTCAQGHKTAGA